MSDLLSIPQLQKGFSRKGSPVIISAIVTYWLFTHPIFDISNSRDLQDKSQTLYSSHYSDVIQWAPWRFNRRRLRCFLNCWFRHRSKKTPKLHVTGLCEGNSPVTGEFPHKRPVTRKMLQLMTSSWTFHQWSILPRKLIQFQLITVKSQWARWRLKSPASRLFTQSFVQAQIKESIKAPRHWPLWGEFTGDRWIPRTKGQ